MIDETKLIMDKYGLRPNDLSGVNFSNSRVSDARFRVFYSPVIRWDSISEYGTDLRDIASPVSLFKGISGEQMVFNSLGHICPFVKDTFGLDIVSSFDELEKVVAMYGRATVIMDGRGEMRSACPTSIIRNSLKLDFDLIGEIRARSGGTLLSRPQGYQNHAQILMRQLYKLRRGAIPSCLTYNSHIFQQSYAFKQRLHIPMDKNAMAQRFGNTFRSGHVRWAAMLTKNGVLQRRYNALSMHGVTPIVSGSNFIYGTDVYGMPTPSTIFLSPMIQHSCAQLLDNSFSDSLSPHGKVDHPLLLSQNNIPSFEYHNDDTYYRSASGNLAVQRYFTNHKDGNAFESIRNTAVCHIGTFYLHYFEEVLRGIKIPTSLSVSEINFMYDLLIDSYAWVVFGPFPGRVDSLKEEIFGNPFICDILSSVLLCKFFTANGRSVPYDLFSVTASGGDKNSYIFLDYVMNKDFVSFSDVKTWEIAL